MTGAIARTVIVTAVVHTVIVNPAVIVKHQILVLVLVLVKIRQRAVLITPVCPMSYGRTIVALCIIIEVLLLLCFITAFAFDIMYVSSCAILLCCCIFCVFLTNCLPHSVNKDEYYTLESLQKEHVSCETKIDQEE